MERKQLTKEASQQAAKPQDGKRPAFCLRLNTFRALSCLSVIVTHIVSFSQVIGKFKSLHFAGHMAVYFFFNLSGYLLSLSLAKEVKRRVFEQKEKTNSQEEEGRRLVGTQSDQVELDFGQPKGYGTSSSKAKEDFRLVSCLQPVKNSLLISILGKFLWNRTWKTFPIYFGAWCVLKAFAHPGTHVETLDPNITWSEIFGLKVFPGHLWTMRIDLMFYFYVVPVYICLLYVAFKLQKAGLKKASKAAFAAIVASLLYTAIYNMVVEESTLHPVKKKRHFTANLPPFCFGMLAGLINFALEQKFNKRQASKATNGDTESEVQDDSLKGKIKAFFIEYRYTMIFTIVFLRILSLSPATTAFFCPKCEAPRWQIANWNSHWYGIFILINDTRGGFWKFMHPKEPQATTLQHPSFVHKMIYYFGLWSYAIYLTHVISYDLLKRIVPKEQYTVEYYVGSVVVAFGLGIVVDFIFDKLLTEKIIHGIIFKKLGQAIKGKQQDRQELELAKVPPSSS